MEKISSLKKIVGLVILWRVALFSFSFWADAFVPYAPTFPYSSQILSVMGLPRWLYSWGNFDGVHYLTIITKGYEGTALIQAFFPVFPLLLSLFQEPFLVGLGANIILTGIICFLLLFAFPSPSKTVIEQRKWWTVIAFFSFPTSFFFGAFYSEAVFLFLVLASFALARKKQWLLASIVAGIASGTRIVGIALWPALLLDLWLQQTPKTWYKLTATSFFSFLKKNWKEIATLSISGLGLGAYMVYLGKTFHDPLYFFHVQNEFGAGREESFVFFPQVIWRYLKILVTVPFDWKFFAYSQEFFISLGVLGLFLWKWKSIRPSYLLFSALAFFLPTVTGTFSSMPRYVLVCFPLFLILGELFATSVKTRRVLLPLFWSLLFLNTVLYIQGYWVA